MSPPLVSCTGLPLPSGVTMQISSSPEASETKAMCLPSGDHLELRSWTPDVLVRLRVGPGFAGTVNTSPRAPNRAA